MKEKPIVNARRINKMRFISGIIICSLVIVLTFVAVALSLTDFFKTGSSEAGMGTLKMFTTLSNIAAAFSAAMCLPFQIDGLRRDRYRLPSWIVVVMYVGTVGVFLTFFSAITIISIYQGFVKTMLSKSGLFLHTINPILITVLFVLTISNTRIKFSYSFISMIPIVIYMIVYFIMVFVAKVWKDHYHTNSVMPWPLSLLLMMSISFGVTQLIRLLHNLTNKHVTKSIEKYYMESPDFEFNRVSDAIAHLVEIESKFYYEGDDIYIPVDIIHLLSERYKAKKVPIDILYDVYLEKYLIDIGKKSVNQ
ncbi:MAG: hypothetical protein J6N95_03925 [Bacilli bacterium]|nr:hypothetical protein [Bacilli bacterium]